MRSAGAGAFRRPGSCSGRRRRPGIRALLYTSTSRLEAGGTQAVFRRLARCLRERGHVVTEAWAGPGGGPVGDGEWICPLAVDTGASHLPSVRSAVAGIPPFARLVAGLADRRPDIVNVHFLTGQTLYFLLLKRMFGYRTVLSAHGSDLARPSASCRRYLPHFLRWADAVTVVSEDLFARASALPGVDPKKVVVIPNGIDDAFWSATEGDESPPLDRPRLVAVGRLERVKGFDVLVEAFARVHRERPELCLHVIGEGSEREALRRQAVALGVGHAVHLDGQRSPREVRACLRGAAAFVLSSRSEGMPLSVLEAMAVGTPVVVTRVGGVPEVVSEDAGWLVPSEAPDALARALLHVTADPTAAAERVEAGRRRARRFSANASAEAYEVLFERILEGRWAA